MRHLVTQVPKRVVVAVVSQEPEKGFWKKLYFSAFVHGAGTRALQEFLVLMASEDIELSHNICGDFVHGHQHGLSCLHADVIIEQLRAQNVSEPAVIFEQILKQYVRTREEWFVHRGSLIDTYA